ncbi:MAG: guanylate kinase [Firmicutes bacterium]|nr:guanylate kinase [Bacillota bacterium]
MTGRIFVLIGPSGVGKTTLASLAHSDGIAERIITCTTRPPRPNEMPGQDYFFFTLAEFTRRDRNGEFVESEWIHGHRYGVLIRELSRTLQSGHRAVISLGYGGAERLKQAWPDQVTIVGILPPSSDSLRQRLKERGTQDAEMILRLQAIDHEFETVRALADSMVVNDQLSAAYQQLRQILSVGASSPHIDDN